MKMRNILLRLCVVSALLLSSCDILVYFDDVNITDGATDSSNNEDDNTDNSDNQDDVTNEDGGDDNANDDTTEDEASIILKSSDRITVTCNSVKGFIKYELINPKDNLSVEAVSSVEWITTDTSMANQVNFSVEANELFYEREGVITVTYNTTSFDVTVIQPGAERSEEIHIEVPYVLGHYYGDYAKCNYNYYLVFSESNYDSNNSFYAEGYKFFVDIYATEHPEDYSYIRIPNGVYTFNPDNDGRAETFLESFSIYKVYDSNGIQVDEKNYSEGILTVTDNLLKLEVKFINDIDLYVVTFSGDYNMLDMRSVAGGLN